jgi:hypothetical protein
MASVFIGSVGSASPAAEHLRGRANIAPRYVPGMPEVQARAGEPEPHAAPYGSLGPVGASEVARAVRHCVGQFSMSLDPEPSKFATNRIKYLAVRRSKARSQLFALKCLCQPG